MDKNIKKQQAIELMKKLGMQSDYIKEFQEKDRVYCFGDCPSWADEDPELNAKIKELEESYKCLVYAVTHEHTEFGECYSFLFGSNEEEDWEFLLQDYEGDDYLEEVDIDDILDVAVKPQKFIVAAYVWNKTYPYFSEFGDVGIQQVAGQLRRIF